MRHIGIDCFVDDDSRILQGHRAGVLQFEGEGNYINLYMPMGDPLPKLQELRDACNLQIEAIQAERSKAAEIQAQASPEEQKDDPDLVPVLVPLVDEIPF